MEVENENSKKTTETFQCEHVKTNNDLLYSDGDTVG